MHTKAILLLTSSLLLLTACSEPAISFKERPDYQVKKTESKPIDEQVEKLVQGTGLDSSATPQQETNTNSTSASENKVIQSTGNELRKVKVVEVVDVDTIKFYDPSLGKVATARLIGINGPESTKEVQYLGKEGTEFLTNLLLGQEIQIEADPNADVTDRYGRYLIHAFIGGKSIQQILLMEGLVRVAYLYGEYKYIDSYKAAEDAARKAGLNIWEIAGYVDSKNGFNMDVISNKAEDATEGLKQEVLNKANEWKKKLLNKN